MNRVIEVTKCAECPYNIVPSMMQAHICNHPKIPEHKEIPQLESTNLPPSIMFPDFCPLETAEDFAESNFDIDREF